MNKGHGLSKMLVVLPREDVKRIEAEVDAGRYVTKSDFFRFAVKRLLYAEEEAGALALAKMPTQKQILDALDENMGRFGKFSVKRVGVFGSYARGEAKPNSDIDILVEFHDGKNSLHNYMGLKLLLEDIFKRKVDLVEKDAIRQELKKRILGETVYA